MAPHRSHRRSTAVLSGLTTLALLGGTYASFTSSAEADDQQIGTGTLSLRVVPGTDAGPVSQPIANMAAGDTVVRFLDLLNDGSLDIGGITASQTNLGGTLVTDDAGVELRLDECSVPWDAVTGGCAGVEGVALLQTQLRTWDAQTDLVLDLDLTAGAASHLKASWHLPAGADNTLQASSDEVTLSFGAVQRAALTHDGIAVPAGPTMSMTASSTTDDTAFLRWASPVSAPVDLYRVYADGELVASTRGTDHGGGVRGVDLRAVAGTTTYRVVAAGADGPLAAGEVALTAPSAYRSMMLDTAPAFYHSGSEVVVGGNEYFPWSPFDPDVFRVVERAAGLQLVESVVPAGQYNGTRMGMWFDKNPSWPGAWDGSSSYTWSMWVQSDGDCLTCTRTDGAPFVGFPAGGGVYVVPTAGDPRVEVSLPALTDSDNPGERRYVVGLKSSLSTAPTHLSLVFDTAAEEFRLYLDGVVVDSYSTAGKQLDRLANGNMQWIRLNDAARMGEIALHHRALSRSEIDALRAAGAGS